MTFATTPEMAAAIDTAKAAHLYHGYGAVYEPGPNDRCPNCADVGYLVFRVENPEAKHYGMVFVPDQNKPIHVETRQYPCPVCRSQADIIAHLWRDAGVELNERSWRLDYLEGREGKIVALAAARELLAETPRPAGWLTLYGDYGRGKSGILKALTAQFITAGVSARYARAADVLAAIRETYSDKHGLSDSRVLDSYAGMRVLALDEVDRTSDTAWAREMLFKLLDTRYNRRTTTATILAFNTSPDAMPDSLRYLASRMTDGRMVAVSGEDLRGQK